MDRHPARLIPGTAPTTLKEYAQTMEQRNSKPSCIKGENYLGFFLLILALMAFALIVKSCNIAHYQHQQQQMEAHDS